MPCEALAATVYSTASPRTDPRVGAPSPSSAHREQEDARDVRNQSLRHSGSTTRTIAAFVHAAIEPADSHRDQHFPLEVHMMHWVPDNFAVPHRVPFEPSPQHVPARAIANHRDAGLSDLELARWDAVQLVLLPAGR